MNDRKKIADLLKSIATVDLWAELGRRFDVKFGKIKLAFHGGRPSGVAELDIRVSLNDDRCSDAG